MAVGHNRRFSFINNNKYCQVLITFYKIGYNQSNVRKVTNYVLS